VLAGSTRVLVALTERNKVELQAGGFRFGQHARTLQQDEAWLAPLGETP
jgi:hypothetical protein